MKSIKFFAVASAVALLSTAGFTSCNQKNGPEWPSNLKEGEVVKTEFSISIPEAGKVRAAGAPEVLRMPKANTQDEATDFLGMDNIVLIPFKTAESGTTGNKVSAPVENGSTREGNKSIHLSNIGGTGMGNIGTNGLAGNANYKVYSNVEIPLNTNRFLFYAHGTADNANIADKFNYGSLIVAGMDASTPGTMPASGAISFSHEQIYTTTGDDPKATAIAAYLTTIAVAEQDADHRWDNHENDDIKALYTAFTQMQAGSSTSVLAAIEDLYNSLEVYQEAYKPAHGNSYDPIVTAIMTAIKVQIDAESLLSGTVGARTLAWGGSSNCAGYPANINLPDGAAAIAWKPSENKFEVANTYAWAAANNNLVSLNIAPCTDYVFPACIYYYANSGLKTSTSSQVANYGSNSWADIITNYYSAVADNISIATNTRSVAIVDPIQYGVARMKTSVKAGDTNIKDYKNVNYDVTKFEVTAVLVGEQGPVGFDFSPVSTLPAEKYKKIVYDRSMSPGATADAYYLKADHTTYTEANPTLLLESMPNKKILIAVEFMNHGEDFYGASGKIIPKNTKFYVVAELDPSNPTSTPTSDKGNPGNCVFKQDHTTIVRLNLTTLTKAYNLVPDLRTSGLELGFSVDLSWQEGYSFDIDI